MVTKEQLEAGLQLVRGIADAIKELGSVPSGHLYARLMGVMSLSEYQQIIGMLVSSGLVKQEASHLLVWVG
jgi:hypothetical protein